MATTDKLFVVEAEDGVVGVEEFRVEDDLDSVRRAVEQLNPADLVQDRVVGIVGHVVGRYRRERVSLEGEDSALEQDLVLFAQQGSGIGDFSTVLADRSANPG